MKAEPLAGVLVSVGCAESGCDYNIRSTDAAENVATFHANNSNFSVKIPLHPFLADGGFHNRHSPN